MANRQKLRPDRSIAGLTPSSSAIGWHADRIIESITDLKELLNLAMSGIKSSYSMTILLQERNEHSKSATVQLQSPNYLQAMAAMLQHVRNDILQTSAALAQPNIDKLCWTVPSYRSLVEAFKRVPELLNDVQEHYSRITSIGRMSDTGDKFDRLHHEMIQLQHGSDDLEGGNASWMSCVRDVSYVLDYLDKNGQHLVR
jgi:hypothetical protein